MSPGRLHEENVYDYIICGGGTTGCVIAGRLAEDTNASILLIEAGQHNENLENTQMAGGWGKLLGSAETDWNIETVPGPNIDNRRIAASRGRYLGGCSGCNGTLCIRGCKQDFDDWGLEGWSGEEFFEHMKRAETFHDKQWFKADKSAHGTNGPLHIEPHDMAPISKMLLDSFESKGLPLDHDMFSTGETPHGCGHAPRTVHQGVRTTGADFVTKGYHRDNITIMVNTTVDRVVLEQDGSTLRATGVEVVSKDGRRSIPHARKEVIVSGGAYCSPAILMRSGIGPKAELEKHQIPVTLDRPGVGANLLDHLIVTVFYETEKPGLTNDHLVYHDEGLANSYKQWKDTKTGFLSTFPFGAFAYARLSDRLQDSPLWTSSPHAPNRDPMGLTDRQPNIEFFSTECYGGPPFYKDFPTDHKHVFGLISELFSPRSKGTVTLASKDPLAIPVVDHNYLSDPLDMLVISEACRFGNEIVMGGAGTKDIIKGSWPADLTHHAFTERKEWEAHVRQNATTCYHAAGTCKMGRDDDAMAVLDAELRVRGVEALRVADVSVMPALHGGHTQMPAYGIGEKAAKMIKRAAAGAGKAR